MDARWPTRDMRDVVANSVGIVIGMLLALTAWALDAESRSLDSAEWPIS